MYGTILCSTVALLLLCSIDAILAQDVPELVNFSDPSYGLEGLRPDGWSPLGPGLVGRQQTPDDVTLVAIQSAPLAPDALWTALLPQLGLGAAPEPVGSHDSVAFSWTLYQFDANPGARTLRFDLALAELDGTTYLVLLQAPADEYGALHDAVFLPVMESLAPIVEDAPPYYVEEVTFQNGDITLAGTLTRPDVPGQHPAVVLMTGTGPQTRDEMVVPGFPIFKLIADYLTQQGIAVLRYDDRGVGQSDGDYDSASIYDFASDGQAAVDYLKTRDDIDPAQVGILGHSEGGVYASIIGANPESDVAFIISMAGTAVPGTELLNRQNEMILAASGASDEAIDAQLAYLEALYPLIAERDWGAVRTMTEARYRALWEGLTDAEREAQGIGDLDSFVLPNTDSFLQNYGNESFATLLEYDPAEGWVMTTTPVLAIFGELDHQVDPAQNALPMEAALDAAGNEDFTIVIVDYANHLFQEAVTGALDEYINLPATFTEDLLPLVGDWLREHVHTVAG